MSINDAPPEEWDAIKADRYYDNRPFDIKDATCVLPANHHEMMRRDREHREEWDKAKEYDNVENPMHYEGVIECIDYIEDRLVP